MRLNHAIIMKINWRGVMEYVSSLSGWIWSKRVICTNFPTCSNHTHVNRRGLSATENSAEKMVINREKVFCRLCTKWKVSVWPEPYQDTRNMSAVNTLCDVIDQACYLPQKKMSEINSSENFPNPKKCVLCEALEFLDWIWLCDIGSVGWWWFYWYYKYCSAAPASYSDDLLCLPTLIW